MNRSVICRSLVLGAMTYCAQSAAAGTEIQAAQAGAAAVYRHADAGALPAGDAEPACGEDFNRVDRLYGEDGWSRIDRSSLPTPWEPPVARRWDQGNPYSGSVTGVPGSTITVEYVSYNHGTASVWAITPPIDFAPGNSLAFWARSLPAEGGGFLGGPAPDRMFVRLCSAMPCDDVGDDADSVGDFATTLLAINEDLAPPETADGLPSFPFFWSPYVVDGLPQAGTGRIAFHYHVPDVWLFDPATWPDWGVNGTQVNVDAVELRDNPVCPFRHDRLFGAGFESDAVGVTQNVDPNTVVSSLMIGCALQPTSWLRRFALAEVAATPANDNGVLEIESVDVGVELARKNQYVAATLYTIPVGTELAYANLTQIGTSRTLVAIGDGGRIKRLPIGGLIELPGDGSPADVDLVVEVEAEDGLEFLLGANSAGQTGPSYLAAPGCGNPEPTDLATGDFQGQSYPDTHAVMTANFAAARR